MLQGGSLTRPETSSVVCGDGTWIRARTNAAPGDAAADPVTGEIRPRRCDPNAVAYNSQQGRGRGLMCVFGTVRNQHPGERIIAFAEIWPRRADANVFTDNLLRLRETHPQIARGATAVVYDRALQPPAIDRLQNAAAIALSKPKRNPDGGPPTTTAYTDSEKTSNRSTTTSSPGSPTGEPTHTAADDSNSTSSATKTGGSSPTGDGAPAATSPTGSANSQPSNRPTTPKPAPNPARTPNSRHKAREPQ